MADQQVVSMGDDQFPAQPESKVSWSGSVGITNVNVDIISGLAGHISTKACQKVLNAALAMPKLLKSELLPRVDVWPQSFSRSPPTDYSIAIYFFPQKGRCEQVWDRLLIYMFCNDLALKTLINNVELLIFTSLLLPQAHHRFQEKYYLWGVFKKKKVSASHQSADWSLSLVNDAGARMERTHITLSETTLHPSKRIRRDSTPVLVEGEMKLLSCRYCNKVMRTGVVTRYMKHLAGENFKKFVTCCPGVPIEVKEEMKTMLAKISNIKLLKQRAKKKLLEKYARIRMLKGVKKAHGRQIKENNRELQIKRDSAWKHAVEVRGVKNMIICRYCEELFSSSRFILFKQHLAGGDSSVQTTKCAYVPIEVQEEMKRLLGKRALGVDGAHREKINVKLPDQQDAVDATELSRQNSAETYESSQCGDQVNRTGSSQTENIMNLYSAASLQQFGPIKEQEAPKVKNVPHSTTHISEMKHGPDTQETTVTPHLKEAVADSFPVGEEEATDTTRVGCENSAQSSFSMSTTFNEVVDSGKNGAADTSIPQKEPHSMPSSSAQILQAITDKYGDIAGGCCFKSERMRANVVEKVCEAIQELKDIQFTHCQAHHLKILDDTINDAKVVNMDVIWLEKLRDDIKEALHALQTYKHLQDALDKREMVVESDIMVLASKIADLKELESEVNSLESHLASLATGIDLNGAMSEFKYFPFESLVDGLL